MKVVSLTTAFSGPGKRVPVNSADKNVRLPLSRYAVDCHVDDRVFVWATMSP